MALSKFGTVSAAVILGVFSYSGARAIGKLPALGPFLDPANGIWANAQHAEFPKDASLSIAGLAADTKIIYDDRDVPHIFASSVNDAYRAMGYVVARDRLFQMEMQARAGAGTLTELVGASPAVLDLDKQTRQLGMGRAAELRWKATDTTSANSLIAAAYVEGANSYIDALNPRDYPLEYKLLHRKPERWSQEKSFNLLMRMGYTLASSQDELTLLQASALVGKDAARALFAEHSPIVEPIQPNGLPAARFDSLKLPPPGKPDSAAVAFLAPLGADGIAKLAAMSSPRGPDAVGSNNWAVAPSRSANGHALLAGDPHLDLSLPSIWYEVHLVVPGKLDVYGVTIPGAPGVIIGFNRDVAWTVTNVGADVMDYYAEEVDDQKNPTKYKLDGAWKPLEIRQELYRAPDGSIAKTDTMRFTHRGPLNKVGQRWISIRWTVLESSGDEAAFSGAAVATNTEDMMNAFAAAYHAPAQNLIVADRAGTIGIRSTGRYPLRPGDGRGDALRDGSQSASDWTGDWPVSEYPQSLKPARGFLSSNNQEPFDPKDQPRYFGSSWERPWRGMRINELLRADSAVTADKMRQFQSDPGSARADVFVPAFLAVGASASSITPSDKLKKATSLLSEWDRRYTKDNKRAVLFETAMQQLALKTWDELEDRDSTKRNPLPNDMMTAALLAQPDSPWWDDHRTTPLEHRDAILASALEAAYDIVTSKYGADANSDKWRWDNIRFANIYHMLRIPTFSRLKVPVQGGNGTLWPSTGDGAHGPSWRMVVELGPKVTAWGTYPGGQSGNPLSARYDNRIDQWSRGELDSLRVPAKPEELSAVQQHARLTLTPRK